MSCFDDPSYMAQAKDEIRQYVETGQFPRWWSRDAEKAPPASGNRYFRDWELRAIVTALRKAGPRGPYMRFMPNLPGRSERSISAKIEAEGGRESFLQKYGDLA